MRGRVLLEKLAVAQVFKKILVLYVTPQDSLKSSCIIITIIIIIIIGGAVLSP
jgi:hypothetical protein